MSTFQKAEAGQFYAVGVGPGSPDLLTYRAAKIIETADVVIAPRSRMAAESLALKTVKAVLRQNQEIIDHVYAMKRDTAQCHSNWSEIARIAAERCRKGKSVVQITIGDPLVYSTSYYLIAELRKLIPDNKISVIPGISAFQAIAAKFGDALTIQEDRMTLMPATCLDHVEKAIKSCETLVLYKAGKRIPELIALFERYHIIDSAKAVFYAEQPGREFIADDLRQVVSQQPGYMATVIVHIDRRTWH